ncbi:Transcription initiation factor IIF subunit alpha [Aphelenchoides bicaudatus]|nr:Transcription initiation factor IIF subunit alpha [Aphelenchoides bicaudatus]
MATHQLPIKTDLKVEQNADSPSNVQSQPASNEFQVIVPENANKKRYSILQFNGPLNVDPGHWPQAQVAMAREDNRAHTIGPSENIQEFGEGSEYGRAAREEARRKKYGRQTRTYHHDRQPWQLLLRDGNGSAKDRIFRSAVLEAHSDYWVFLKAGNNFHAHKVDDWFRFMPNPQKKGLDIDQVEEQFQQRNKVLNQFALKMKIQQTIKDQDEDGEKMSKPSLLKIKDEASSDEEDNNGEESKRDEDEETSSNKKGKKKKGKEARERKDKKQRVKNADEVAAYESEDGEDEGREYDYISDSGSNTSREEMTVDEKVDQAMIAVGDETGMRDDASDEESMDDSEDENQDEAAKQKRNLLKKLNEQKEGKTDEEKTLRLTDKLDERDSSGSDTDDPDNPKGHQSVLFLQAKARKRHAEDEEEVNEDEPAKRAKPPTREQTPQPLSASQPSTSAVVEIDGLNEDTVRRMLMQRPMSTKDLVGKFRAKMPNMSKEDVVTRLAEILGVLKPERVNRTVNKKNVLYFSLTKNH